MNYYFKGYIINSEAYSDIEYFKERCVKSGVIQ